MFAKPTSDRRQIHRRCWLQSAISANLGLAVFGAGAKTGACHALPSKGDDRSYFQTRGVVLAVSDLQSLDWPQRAKEAGLTTIGTHISPRQVSRFVKSDKGQAFIEKCKKLQVHVEHELHAMSDLLPRSLFAKNPHMFRMNKKGERSPDWNLCVHSRSSVQQVCENAVKYAQVLKPTTGRYFYWIDDNQPMCHCPKCVELSPSDQALLLENHILTALRRIDPPAKLAHLAYMKTLPPPTKIKPAAGIFLEFAPIVRSWEAPLSRGKTIGSLRQYRQTHGDTLELLRANLEVFGGADAQVLEYWLDVSRFSLWKRPAKKLPWRREVFVDDVKTYARYGIRHITSFAVMIDSDYIQRFGEPPVNEYGRVLRDFSTPAE